MIGRVGADTFGDQVLTALSGFDVDVSAIRRDDANATGIAIIGVDAKGENAITVIGGANMAMTAGDLDAADRTLRGAAIVMTSYNFV